MAWLSTLAVLVAARADHACAGRGHAAVITVRQRWPRSRRWVRSGVFAATLPVGAVALASPPALLLVASAVADAAGRPLAATVLVRQMLRHADAHRLAVLARPRDRRLADLYAALGFRELADGRGRVLLRAPRGGRRLPAA